MWIVEFGLRMWPGHPIYVRLLLDSEVNSKLNWIVPLCGLAALAVPPHLYAPLHVFSGPLLGS
jgi:hypothetical protein